MTRTFRKRTRDTSGRRVVPTSRARPVRVCDRDVCRDAARALGGDSG